ncbi:MAG: hypothetical protein WC975_09305 [Phycisphaerae bacterium]
MNTQGYVSFHSAKPVWLTDRESEKNLLVGFRAIFTPPQDNSVLLRITACSRYRVYVNGEFAGCGPVVGPHGYYRVDEWNLNHRLTEGDNLIAVEVAGYNVNSYYLLDQPSFLQAEVVCEGNILVSTAGDGVRFDAVLLRHRIQKVQRYSFQRPFTEVYRLTNGFDEWRKNKSRTSPRESCQITTPKQLLPRRVGYPRFELRPPAIQCAKGELEKVDLPRDQIWKDRSMTGICATLKGFPETELDTVPSIELQRYRNKTNTSLNIPCLPDSSLPFAENSWQILDFAGNLTGFIGFRITCNEPTRFFLTFDEILCNHDVSFKRLDCVNILAVEAPAGTFDLETFEPYTLRYLKLLVLKGNCRVEGLCLRQYKNSEVYRAGFSCSDPCLNTLFDAGRETFAQNSIETLMDCPSRERAQWLCDSAFSGRVAFDLTGHTRLEENLFEDYLLPERFEYLPEGMLPMCYPADHYDGVFIPNWALWFIIQLEEYAQRSRNISILAALKSKVYKLLGYFTPFVNEYGLLEKLQNWVFVEWSAANQFVQDVNFPSNMLYAAALAAVGRLYLDPNLLLQAERIRDTIRKMAFDGEFFVDNAVRENGKLCVTRNRTEVCQYYAFFFEAAHPKTDAKLWNTLQKDFGPQRKTRNLHPEIHFANAFIGNFLRMELLARYGAARQVLEESVGYLLHMAQQTGTLWEHDDVRASCNHSFASHVVHILYRDILGVAQIDKGTKTIFLRFNDLPLSWAQGRIPLDEDTISIKWWKENQQVRYAIDHPAGYRVETLDPHFSVRREKA